MQLPAFIGRFVYFFGYPIFRLLIKNTHRAYVLVVVNDSVLLTQNWLGMQKKWRLPGGGVHVGERAIDAVVRELEEELCLKITKEKLTQLTRQPIKAEFNYTYDLFMVQFTAMPKIAPDKKEILDAKLYTAKELVAVRIGEEAATALRLAGWCK